MVIVAAGLTPAWQNILEFDAILPGEVNRARGAWHCASGKVVNVALAAHRLGGPTRIVTLVGGKTGEAIRDELSRAGAEGRWVETEAATRVCTTLLEAGSGKVTELVEESPAVAESELAAFADEFRRGTHDAGVIVLTGSLPRETRRSFYNELLDGVGVPVILDVRGPELLAALGRRPLLVKPNREELMLTAGAALDNEGGLRVAVQKLHEAGAQWVLVSSGREAAWLASRDEAYRVWPANCAAINPIGSGDCLAAGIAWGVRAGRTMVEAVRLGMAAGAENARTRLPSRLELGRVEALAKQIRVERVRT